MNKALKAHNKNSIHFKTKGNGPAIVLLHGFLEDLSMWDHLSDQIPDNYQVISIDLPGHGKTEGVHTVHTMELMASAVKAVLDFLEVKEAILIGHSMGGYVSLAFAEEYPEMVKGLCLANSTSRADSPEKRTNRDRGAKAALHNPRNFVSLLIPNLFDPELRETYRSDIDRMINIASGMRGENIAAALQGMKTRPDREHVLRKLNDRAMVMVGRNDPVLDYEDILEQVEASDIALIEMDGGHMSFIEDEEVFSYNILHFIEKL